MSLARRAFLFLTIVMVLGPPPSADAWGDKGHRLVGNVARELLSADARAAVIELMGSDDLAKFALYLDQQKDRLDQQIPGSREWHYDDVPICESKPYAEYCPDGRCASTQIVSHQRLLSDSHEDKKRKSHRWSSAALAARTRSRWPEASSRSTPYEPPSGKKAAFETGSPSRIRLPKMCLTGSSQVFGVAGTSR